MSLVGAVRRRDRAGVRDGVGNLTIAQLLRDGPPSEPPARSGPGHEHEHDTICPAHEHEHEHDIRGRGGVGSSTIARLRVFPSAEAELGHRRFQQLLRCRVGLDKNKVIAIDQVSIGSLTASVVHPRQVFKSIVPANVAASICLQNHPSGVISRERPFRRRPCGQSPGEGTACGAG